MPAIGYMLAAIVMGGLVSIQPLINAVLARAIGSAIGAATISITVAFLGALALVAATGPGDMRLATLGAVPWWVYLAGTIGTVFVAGGVLVAPVIGALLFVVCVIAGQLTGALVADHFGAFGLAVRPVSLVRLLGLVLVLAGAVMVLRG